MKPVGVYQTCVNHLLRRCRELRTDYPRAPLPGQVQDVLHDALAVRDRHAAGEISAHGVVVARGRLTNRLSGILEQRTTVPDIERFMCHLDREWDALFTFLFDSTIDATNWRAEQALRGAVITRKVCGGGNRTTRGAVTQQVLASILRTARQRDLDAHTILTPLLCAPTAIVSPAFHRSAAGARRLASVAAG
jgi:transposase